MKVHLIIARIPRIITDKTLSFDNEIRMSTKGPFLDFILSLAFSAFPVIQPDSSILQ